MVETATTVCCVFLQGDRICSFWSNRTKMWKAKGQGEKRTLESNLGSQNGRGAWERACCLGKTIHVYNIYIYINPHLTIPLFHLPRVPFLHGMSMDMSWLLLTRLEEVFNFLWVPRLKPHDVLPQTATQKQLPLTNVDPG